MLITIKRTVGPLPNEENYFVLGLVSTSGSFDDFADNGEVVKMIKHYRSMLA
jgi:hypothetical protein